MINEQDHNLTLPPPLIPLKVFKEPVPAPVIPPKIMAAPLLPKDEPAVQEPAVGRRWKRQPGQEGLDPGDPRSTVQLFRRGIGNVARTLPPILQRYAWVLPVVLLVWTLLGSFNAYRLMSSVPALTPLWVFLDKIVGLLVFLTAAYNNFVGKALYGTLFFKVILPLLRRMRREGVVKVGGEFKSLLPNLLVNWSAVGTRSIGLIIFFAGCGAFVSNFLTRNNAFNKTAVSLAVAFTLMKTLSTGSRSIPFMTGRVVMNDVFAALKRPSPVRNQHLFIAISGLVLGFLSSVLLALLRSSMGDNIGYILGAIAMAAGIVLFFVLKSKKAEENTDAQI